MKFSCLVDLLKDKGYISIDNFKFGRLYESNYEIVIDKLYEKAIDYANNNKSTVVYRYNSVKLYVINCDKII